jgi:hypothetical protein
MLPIDEIYPLPDGIDMNISGKQASRINWLVRDALAEIQQHGPLPGDIEGADKIANMERLKEECGRVAICHWMTLCQCLSMSTNAFIICTTLGLSGFTAWVFILLLLPQHRC